MKRIIVLDRIGPKAYRVALWAEVPPILQAAQARIAKPTEFEFATQEEKDAILSGQIVEKVIEIEADTLAQARQDLIATWTAFQNNVSSVTKRSLYGTYYDGTSWTAGG